MPHPLRTMLCVLVFSLFAVGSAQAAESYGSWGEIADDMVNFLNEAGDKYADGDVDGAKKSVNDAYFGLYEKMGFERTVMSYISGKRVSLVEYKFSYVKRQMTNGVALEEVRSELANLCKLLKEDADQLDGVTVDAPEENEDFIVPTEEELREFDAAVSPEGLTPEEFEELKIQYIQEKRKLKEDQ